MNMGGRGASSPLGKRGFGKRVDKTEKSGIMKEEILKAGVHGTINIPPVKVDVNKLTFNREHINVQRNHNITEQEAKSFINNAKVSITRWNGRFENFYGENGAAFVDLATNSIRTAFSSAEYNDSVKTMMEVLRKYEKR